MAGSAMRLLMQTVMRNREACDLRAEYVDLENRWIELPGRTTKNGSAFRVVLNDTAVGIITLVSSHADFQPIVDNHFSTEFWRQPSTPDLEAASSDYEAAKAGSARIPTNHVTKRPAQGLRAVIATLEVFSLPAADPWHSLRPVAVVAAALDVWPTRGHVAIPRFEQVRLPLARDWIIDTHECDRELRHLAGWHAVTQGKALSPRAFT